jgi:hypothetical protein
LRNGSQKKARVSAVRMSSGGLSPAMTTMTTMETQRRNSVSPRSAMASRTPRRPSSGELR